jgi:hypothetical protein
MAMTRARCLALLASLTLSGCDSGRITVVVPGPTTLNQDLVAHYTFDEASGITAYDHSGNGYNGTVFGNVGSWYWLPGGGVFGGALHLGGASDAGASDGETDYAGASDAGASDAGASDAGASDVGATDVGASDVGASDGGATDVGASDVGASDVGATDVGASDAGANDAGGNDAATSDAGATDAGGNDAGTSDAGANDAGASGDYVTVQNFPDAPSDFTVSAWIRTPDQPIEFFNTILSTEIGLHAGWELNLMHLGGGLGTQFAYWDVISSPPYDLQEYSIPSNQWTHVTAVVDGTAMTLSLYVGDQLVGQMHVLHVIAPGSSTLYMGAWVSDPDAGGTYSRFLVGDIDDVAIYGRALQPAEVRELGVHPPPDRL